METDNRFQFPSLSIRIVDAIASNAQSAMKAGEWWMCSDTNAVPICFSKKVLPARVPASSTMMTDVVFLIISQFAVCSKPFGI